MHICSILIHQVRTGHSKPRGQLCKQSYERRILATGINGQNHIVGLEIQLLM